MYESKSHYLVDIPITHSGRIIRIKSPSVSDERFQLETVVLRSHIFEITCIPNTESVESKLWAKRR